MFYSLPKLNYSYDALEPYIDTQTMETHHNKHHAGYVKKLNTALEKWEGFEKKEINQLLQDVSKIPENIRQAVINNGGGHAHHTLFWKIMKPNGGGKPVGKLREAIDQTFESFEQFMQTFNDKALQQFGSGWVWLVLEEDNTPAIISTPNQDSPWSMGKRPILTNDVWEHAYYLKYQNKRVEYIENWWNVVNWKKANELFEEYIS